MSTRDSNSKDAAVARVRAGETVGVVAADVGVHPSTVRRWVKAAPALPTPGEPEPFTLHRITFEPVVLDPVAPLENVPLFPEADARTVARSSTRPESAAESEGRVEPDPEPEPDPAPEEPVPAPEEPVPAPEGEPEEQVPEREDESALDQLQSLASAPGDAIVRFGQRLPPLERYLIVVTAWCVSVVIGGIAPDSHPGRGYLVALHLLAMTVAFGSVMALDWHGILWERRQRAISESIRLSHALTPLIWGGLAVLFVTGALLAPDLTTTLTWVKLVSVLVLALNGVATSQLRRHLVSGTDDGLRSLPLGPRSRVVFSSVLSQVCWLTAVLIGLATTMSR